MSISLTTNWLLIDYNFDLFLVSCFYFTWRQWKNLTPVIFIWVYLHYPYRAILRGIKIAFQSLWYRWELWTFTDIMTMPFSQSGSIYRDLYQNSKLALNSKWSSCSFLSAGIIGVRSTMSGKFSFYYWQREGVGLDDI